jgi:hypothetical protein
MARTLRLEQVEAELVRVFVDSENERGMSAVVDSHELEDGIWRCHEGEGPVTLHEVRPAAAGPDAAVGTAEVAELEPESQAGPEPPPDELEPDELEVPEQPPEPPPPPQEGPGHPAGEPDPDVA